MSADDEFRIFLVREKKGTVYLLGRIISTATAITTESYYEHAWHNSPGLMGWLEGQNPGLGVEIDESEVPRYMKMVDDQNDKAGGTGDE